MSIFNNIGKKVGGAAHSAARRSGDIVEITKANMSISTEEEKIQKMYFKVGKALYEAYKESPAGLERFGQDCEQILQHEKTIADLNTRIKALKSEKVCPGCQSIIELYAEFCPKCGVKQPTLSVLQKPGT